MSKCPLSGMPCPLQKCIHVADINKNYEAESNMELCLVCGIPFFEEEMKIKKKPKKCSCGFSLKDIVENSKLGCSQCYETFKEQMERLLNKVHGATRHKGKRPKKNLEDLKIDLENAIKKEDYELAAKIRDKIKEDLQE